jgi:SAM-dependent methyltransferase
MGTSIPALREILTRYILESDNPDLITYGRGFLDHFDATVVRLRHLMRAGRLERARVLDVGCGFGWQAVCIALLGDNEVVANDIRESMIDPLAARVGALQNAGVAARITTLLGDICRLDIPPASYDGVFCYQTVEHVHDLDTMFARCFALLRPGGHAVIVNDNNALNRKTVAENREMWHRRDTSQAYIDELKRERPIENRDIEPYAQMRARIVRECRPALTAEQVDDAVQATAGLTRAEIVRVLGDWAPGRPWPTRPAHSWCRNPETGEFCERLLDPYDLAARLRRAGFGVSVQHLFMRAPLRWLNRTGLRWVQQALFELRPIFVLVAHKPA